MKKNILPWAIAAVCGVASIALVATAKAPGAQCGAGFFPVGHRCCAAVSGDGKTCGPARTCPAPLAMSSTQDGACVAPEVVVEIPETRLTIGASDWEADKVVHAREIHVMPFALDAFEVTEARLHAPDRVSDEQDGARAAAGISRDEMIAYCTHRGGRLPTEDEWIAAASGANAGANGTRYPWGDTGAVCRRAAWGMKDGPCAHGASGPDTVGAHEDGDTALGVHDLAGNVAEWVSVSDASAHAGAGVVLGGSFASSLASELRVWSRAYVDPAAHDFTVGGRCAFDRGQR